MKKLIYLLTVLAGTLGVLAAHPHSATAAFNPNNLMDDNVFQNSTSMNAAQIDTWINQFPGSCISSNNGFTTPDPHGWEVNHYAFGGNITAGQAIYDAAQLYRVNPQVILATMQKEQSLVTGSAGCHPNTPDPATATNSPCGSAKTPCTIACQYAGGCMNIAMGYGCPNYCAAVDEGFSMQLTLGTWLLRFGQQRAFGNLTGYIGYEQGDENFTYTGPMVQGTRQRCASCAAISYDGTYTTQDSVSVTIANGATATLYNFTPFTSGNSNFVNIFAGWFGPTTSLLGGLTMATIQQPNPTPARGETVTYTFSLTNTFTVPVTLSGVGAVGRLGTLNGANRDFGWQGSVTLQPNATQQFSFTSTLTDTGTMYAWPAVLYQGAYAQYNNWGTTLTIHAPNLTLSQPLVTNATTVYAGQDVTFSAVLKNNETHAINYDAIGIPVKFYDRYSYDAVWVGPGTIGPGAEVTLSGTRNIDKPGPFTYWVSNYFSGTYSTIGSVNNFNAVPVSPNFSVSGLSLSSTSPVVGQSLSATFTVKNNLPVPIDIGGLGVVGRLGTFSGPNRDINWQGPVHFNAGETKTFTETGTVTETGTHYYWIGILYNGAYLQYNNWGSTIVSIAPNFSVSGLSFSSTSPVVGSLSTTFSVTNNLPVAIDVDAVGVVGRLGTFTGPNRDLGWQGPVHFNAGETKPFTQVGTIPETGTHYYWIGILYNGAYLQYNNWGSTIVSH